MKIVFEGKIDLPRAEQLLESKGLGLNGPVQQFHTKNVLRRIQKSICPIARALPSS